MQFCRQTTTLTAPTPPQTATEHTKTTELSNSGKVVPNLSPNIRHKNCANPMFLRKKPIQYNITYYLYATIPKIFRTNTYKEIVYYAVNKYFPSNDVILFEKFLIDNNVKENYVSQIKDKYIPTDTTPKNYFLVHPFWSDKFFLELHTKWVNTLYWNMKFSPKYGNDYLSILIIKYTHILKV